MSRARRLRRRKTVRGGLVAIVGLLVASALFRIGDDAGQAWARVVDTPTAQVPDAPMEACRPEDDLHDMLKSFQAREARLKQEESKIAARRQALKLADRQLEEKLASLEAAENKLRQTLTMADTAAEGDIERLTKVYESMKPKQAAALFEEMAPEFAAGFLGRMRPEAAAGVMAGLSPQAAHTFSVVLAGRNAGAPKE
jgi:flagellar motility protein MotE (MotC chaperone)